MDKMKFESADITSQNIEKIAELFPNCITETKDGNGNLKKAINFELLKQDLSKDIVDGKECYEFTWVGKKESIIEANRPIRKTLRPYKEESVNWDTTENLYIEGDNLEVLKLLQESYLGKVKMIYIDPPYNTGNDFIYNDDFKISQDEYEIESGIIDDLGNRFVKNTDTNGRFHSDWCSMIYSRLMLARNLLSEDGFIFISIDDNEQSNLEKICDEIFSERNFIGKLSVENNPKGRKNSDYISVSSEYCLIYAKNKGISRFVENIPKSASDMKMDENGNYVHTGGRRVLVGENDYNPKVTNINSEKNYSVYFRKEDNKLTLKQESIGEIDLKLIKENYIKYYSYFKDQLVENTYTKSAFLDLFKNNQLDFSNGKIYEKNYSDTIRIKSQLVNKKYKAIVHGKKIDFSLELTTTGAGTYLKELFSTENCPFSAPKNIGFLKILVSLLNSNDCIVLDFFSGSSSTADAIMHLNAERNLKMKYIMVQLQENLDSNLKTAKITEKNSILEAINICNQNNVPHLLTEIAKERIRRSAKKIAEENPNATFDGGFRVFKVDDSNMKDVYYAPAEYYQSLLDKLESNIKEDRTDLDLFFGCILDWGLPLNLSYTSETIENCSVHTYSDNALVACFNDNIPESVIKEIAKRKPLRVVFRDSSFADTPSKINVTEIFKLLSPDTRVKVI